MSAINIEFYAEITCPWCVIAHHRLDKVLTERFPGLAVDIVHHPVFLTADCPPEGVLIAELALSKHGISDPSLLWARPEAEAHASELDLVLSRQAYAYPTQAAHTLVRHARARGTQHRLAGAIYTAYFHEARNISNLDVLAEIASRHGFDREEGRRLVRDRTERALTERQAARATAQAIRSVPHFVFDGRIALNGGRSEHELSLAIESAAQRTTEVRP